MAQQTIIRDHRILAGMERQGFILRNGSPRLTERHWTGVQVPVITVKPGPKLRYGNEIFKYRGSEYRIMYFDGCFHPFVTRVGAPLPAFV